MFCGTRKQGTPKHSTHKSMHICSPAGGGCKATASCSSSMNHHHKRVAFRGPLSLLWLALLAVATGPAACFVVLPSSTCLRGAGIFATASPLPKVVPGSRSRQGSWEARNSNSNSGSREQRRLFSRTRSIEDPVREQQEPEDEEEVEEEGMQHGGRQNAPNARSHLASSTGFRNARAFRAVSALSEGKGFRAAASVLRASATGVELDSRVAQTDSRQKRILILMSDTGGGHRASSQALTAALEDLYGDQIHTDTVDIWTDYGRFPFDTPVKMYKFLGKHPILWKLSYDVARFPLTRRGAEILANLTCHRSFRKCMETYKPDLVVSTHPLCHHVPLKVLKRLRRDSGKAIPFVTVVTDLGSGHPTWFDPRGDLVYVPSDVLSQRAQERGISKDKLLQFGLPVRNAFWEQSADKQAVQKKLGLKTGVRTALIVGGGDGVGKLVDIAKNVADRLASDHHPGQVVVVCGTNEKIKEALDTHNWPGEGSGVNVRVLGFVANMDEWMTASDLLVTKAGPGTIAEACTRGLPVIISSYLPGQEAGNVPYVTDNDFGLYRKNPVEIAHEVSDLLADRQRLEQMGENARSMGRPHATLDIARSLVSTMLPGTKEIEKPSSSASTSSSSPPSSPSSSSSASSSPPSSPSPPSYSV